VRDSIFPAAKKQKGFKGLLHLEGRKADKGVLIVLWNTEAGMKAGDGSEYYKEQVAKVVPLNAGPPTTEHYEVVVQG